MASPVKLESNRRRNHDADRPVLPHDLDLERAILGQMIAYGDTTSAFREEGVTPADFFRVAYRKVCEAIFAVADRGCVPDVVIVGRELRARGELDDVGTVEFSRLPDGAPRPAPANITDQAGELRRKAQGRALVRLLERGQREIQENPEIVGNGWIGRYHERLESVLAETHPAASTSLFTTARAISEATPEAVPWIVAGYVAERAITEAAGKAKVAGKTTLMLHLTGCVLDGAPFLGMATTASPVVYLTEQHATTLREQLRRAHLLDREDLSILSYWDVVGRPWPEIVGLAVAEAERIGARLLVVDTLSQFAGLEGDSENSAGSALAALEPLQRAAAKGLGVILVRHERKGGGEVGESARGSSAFTGGVDVVLSIRRPEGNHRLTIRAIEALSRFERTPESLLFERIVSAHPMDGVWAESFIALGSKAEVTAQEAEAAVLEALPADDDSALPLSDLVEISGAKRATVQRALKNLVSAGKVQETGAGKKGNPRRYWAGEIVCAQTSPPNGRNESHPTPT